MSQHNGNAQRVARLIREAGALGVTFKELIEACYPDPDKEPEWADNCIRQAILAAKAKGLAVERVSVYRLKPRRENIAYGQD